MPTPETNDERAEYEALGVELPDAPKPESEEVVEPKIPVVPASEVEVTGKPAVADETTEEKPETEPLQPEPEKQTERKPRSIYQEYKDKKSELRTEKELREAAEKERDEALAKLQSAETPAEKVEAVSDEIEAFANEIGADVATIKRMREVFLKDAGIKAIPDDLREQLETFSKNNTEAADKLAFQEEFKSAEPFVKQLFPTVDATDMDNLKTELDRLAHTDMYHDKELDYIMFKEKDSLAEIVSPKKRGLEQRGRKEPEKSSFKFNPNADITKMSEKESEAWMEEYNKLGAQSDELTTDSLGRRIMI